MLDDAELDAQVAGLLPSREALGILKFHCPGPGRHTVPCTPHHHPVHHPVHHQPVHHQPVHHRPEPGGHHHQPVHHQPVPHQPGHHHGPVGTQPQR
ncbi:hypothetical protein [Streptomyces sp. MAA16]|uniref:hypothetical protein n=1 Tax=Streptomyces sp. MAA16 TaxID=3035116 RepID=UPI002476F68E|nr:hypothetical protein [Streptomyces sp. MAA16]